MRFPPRIRRCGQVLALALLSACSYDPKPRDNFLACVAQADCPVGFSCVPVPDRVPALSLCCRGCGSDAGADAPEADGATVLAVDASADGPTPIDEGPLDRAPADAELTGDTSPDLPPDALTPDALEPDAAGASCRAGRAGPVLVSVAGVCIDATEVTNEQYNAFVLATGNGRDTAGQIAACAWNTDFTPEGASAPWPFPLGRQRRPVVEIDWCDAYAYCAWAGKRLCGKVGGGRLSRVEETTNATLGQWAYACTKGGRLSYPYGNTYDATACNAARAIPSAEFLVDVGASTRCRTEEGVFDLSGNAEEWVDACTGDTGATNRCAVSGASVFHKTAADLSCLGSPYGDIRSSRYELRGFRCCGL